MQHPRIGIGIIVIQDDHVLLGKRKGAHGEGTWATPGGHLKFGESVEEGTKRELFEETGLVAESILRGRWSNDCAEGKHYVTLFMHVTRFSGILEAKEPNKCEKWEWFPTAKLPSPMFFTLVRYPFGQEYSYLACPYSHKDELIKTQRVEAVTHTAFELFKKGISVFSPLTHNAPLMDKGIGQGWAGKWEGFDLGMLSRAHKLYVLTLPGWAESRGVQAEITYAEKLSIPIEKLEPSDWVRQKIFDKCALGLIPSISFPK